MSKTNQAIQDLLRYNAAILPNKRSSFNKSHSHTTTMDSAYLVPLMWDRVLPGDEKQIRYSGLARMATPLHPVMDEANMDVWCFFVPDRLWWDHAKEFYGENLDASFNPDGEYVMPYLTASQFYTNSRVSIFDGIGSLNDYLGMPLADKDASSDFEEFNNIPELRVSAGLWRSYQIIWNEWFRNPSIQGALTINKGDTVTNTEWIDVLRNIRKVNKYPDYFTSMLREPQAGDDVMLPLGDYAPVVTLARTHTSSDPVGLSMDVISDESIDQGYMNLVLDTVPYDGQYVYVDNGGYASGTPYATVYPRNLWADLTSATSATINNLRAAITVQQLLEIDSIAGKRYQQILQAHFGVFTPDATLQRPELLGATRQSIGMRQVLQTSETTDTSPQGNVAAFSLTSLSNEWICNKAFTEPGFIMVLGAIRPVHSYSQGIDCLLTKLNRYDHYWPVFDNLGNQPVHLSELYATIKYDESVGYPTWAQDMNYTFGYKEAWTEYRIKQNRVSGLMRPDSPNTLASWNYSSSFSDRPLLNSTFISEDENLIDRTIAVATEPQFIVDSYFDYIDTKNMGVHSIPGLTRL